MQILTFWNIQLLGLWGTKGLFWPRCIGLSQWARTLVLYLLGLCQYLKDLLLRHSNDTECPLQKPTDQCRSGKCSLFSVSVARNTRMYSAAKHDFQNCNSGSTQSAGYTRNSSFIPAADRRFLCSPILLPDRLRLPLPAFYSIATVGQGSRFPGDKTVCAWRLPLTRI
jgi:hypothetical protein